MKTAINKFWYTFSLIQKDLIYANQTANQQQQNKLCNKLAKKARKVNASLDFLILFQVKDTNTHKLIFLTKGKYTLKAIVAALLAGAPSFPEWNFQMGIKPYKHSVDMLCEAYNFLGVGTKIHQIYFTVQKIYRTTNKLHLIFYLEMDKQLSKSELHEVMHPILLCYLGDIYYQQHISRYKIVRRKYSRIRFIPLDDLRYFIQFKSFN